MRNKRWKRRQSQIFKEKRRKKRRKKREGRTENERSKMKPKL